MSFIPWVGMTNGLPTERRVQNYFHVRCDPLAQNQAGLELSMANAEQRKKPPLLLSRANFIELCLKLTAQDEKVFEELWQRLGLSVDWNLQYSTIDDRSRRIAQWSFLDLHRKGHLYQSLAPTMWDVDFHTAVAQAEVEDRTVTGAFYFVNFGVQGSDESFTIATTRPELLPACVGVTAHPTDQRYRHLFGKFAVTPLFRVPVPIFPSILADKEKGTGILMVCTFGDQTDVLWWRENNLTLRQVLGLDGKLLQVNFGTDVWQSTNPEKANLHYARMQSKGVKEARKIIVEMLADPGAAATGVEPALKRTPLPVEHQVKFFEKGERPLELIPTRQWFVRLLDKKERLIEAGRNIKWHPEFMGLRYQNWAENLQLDWCISRQRYFGVPFPLWYPIDSNGATNYNTPIVADATSLPLDPSLIAPQGFTEQQRNQPGGFRAEEDVFDTWFTSSLTPRIAIDCVSTDSEMSDLFPMDLRPQSHEIIRTWAFYTITKAFLHSGTVPWKNVAISGWVLDPERKKMSKSKGNVLTPIHLLDDYGANAVRYWAANGRLGVDTAFDENVLKVGKRLVTKLFNASKFVLSQTAGPGIISHPLDVAFLAKLDRTVVRVTRAFDGFDCALALTDVEKFFWTHFTDTYLEFVKVRSRSVDDPTGQASAVHTLRIGLNALLRLFAPFLPYITEQIWSWAFADETGMRSIHRAPSEESITSV